jgi:thioredoxin reductase (NADPH)
MNRRPRPVFVLVDDDASALAALRRALVRRYGADYRVLARRSPERGLYLLDRLRRRGERVALVVADQWMPGIDGLELLARAHHLHPSAQRALLFDAFGLDAKESVYQAMALGRVDSWLVKPWEPADHHLYRRVGELLDDWVQASDQPRLTAMRVVAEPRARRTHDLRDLLDRNAVPAEFVAPDSPPGRRLLAQAGEDGSRLPVFVYVDGQVQVDPCTTDIAEALGVRVRPRSDHYDVTVVGAGPAGLSAALCSTSEGLNTLLLEPCTIGGQASSTSMIRNYLGFPRGVSGRQLTELAADQTALFGRDLVFDRATRLELDGRRRLVTLAGGARVTTDAVMLSVGVEYERLVAPGVDELLGAGVFYGAAVCEAPAVAGEEVYVVGAGNSAGQAAVYLARYAERVTVVVRGRSLGASMSDYLVQQVEATPTVNVRLNTEVVSAGGAGRLEHLVLHDAATGRTDEVAAGALFILIGARPHTEWLPHEVARDAAGFVLTGPDLGAAARPAGRPPLPMETSVPGVFAAGDVRHGSAKRVASAVGEGANAIQLAHRYLGELRPGAL